MPRQAVISYQDVAACAEALKQHGVNPTARGVKAKLGTTASMGTINPLLARWREMQTQSSIAGRQISSQLEQAIMRYVDDELAAATKVLQDELSEQKQDVDEFATENARQAEQIESLNAEIAELRNQKAMADGAIAEMAKRNGSLRDDLAQARGSVEEARSALVVAQTRLEYVPRLEEQLKTNRAACDTERDARAKAEMKVAVLTSQNEELKRQLAECLGSSITGSG